MSSDPEMIELRERLLKMSDEELIRMVCEDYDDYREEALRAAEEELERRGIVIDDGSASMNAASNGGGAAVENGVADRGANRATLYCAACGGELRSGYLFAQKEITVLFADNNEERFVDVQACGRCGRVQLAVDYETDVEA